MNDCDGEVPSSGQTRGRRNGRGARAVFTAAAAVVLLAAMMSPAVADVFGPPTDDADINMRSPDYNAGSNDRMRVRNRIGHPSHPENWQSDALIRFDLSEVSFGSAIESATLHVYYFLNHDEDPTGRDLSCFRITGAWDEGTVTWNTRPALAGARTAGAIVPQDYGWMSWDVTLDVQAFADGAAENHGWQIVDEVAFGGFNIPTVYFCSKEYGSDAPYLEIVWLETPVRPTTWSRVKALYR